MAAFYGPGVKWGVLRSKTHPVYSSAWLCNGRQWAMRHGTTDELQITREYYDRFAEHVKQEQTPARPVRERKRVIPPTSV